MLGNVPAKDKVIEALSMHAFESEDSGEDTIEIGIPPNRYSDASSHLGIASELAAILGLQEKENLAQYRKFSVNLPSRKLVGVEVLEKELCPRYGIRYFAVDKVGSSPAWMRKILKACGLKPINDVVDVMNYAMLEIGQPLHAFDFEKIRLGKIIVRSARAGEKIETLDGKKFELEPAMLVIADSDEPLAIAGIKGGKESGVSKDTKKVLVEAANFDAMNIFKTSRKLGLQTDASIRFSHGMSPELVEYGLNRATELLQELCGANILDSADFYPKKQSQSIAEFSISRFNSLLGTALEYETVADYLRRLDFEIARRKNKDSFVVKIPKLRLDVEIPEDLYEEAARIYGYQKIKPAAPVVGLMSHEEEEGVGFRERTKTILASLGLSEVYNGSFAPSGEVEVMNPIAEDKSYLRSNLTDGILLNFETNLKFFDSVRIFEIGKVFKDKEAVGEKWDCAIGIAYKKENPILELKGVIVELFEKIGLVDYGFRDYGDELLIESDHSVLGRLKPLRLELDRMAAIAELDFDKLLNLVEGEKEYEPLPKFPSIMRDISVVVDASVRVGPILEAIQNAAAQYVDDVDLLDHFEDSKLGKNKKSLTFRIVFRASDRTLTDAEADEEMKKIRELLENNFQAEVR